MSHKLDSNKFWRSSNAGNLMSIEEAHALLNEWVPNERLTTAHETSGRRYESMGH